LLDDDTDLPADVLFFAVGMETNTAILEEHGRLLIEELSRFEPCTIDTWAALSEHADREELIELCADLAAMGLVALS
jgi:hypothetical protein